MHSREEIFDAQRSRLFGIAYRMLGSRADAEDTVQDAYIRWHGSEPSEPHNPKAWLATVVTRLCIDRLRAATNGTHIVDVYVMRNPDKLRACLPHPD